MDIKTELLTFNNWVFRVRVPSGEGPHPVLFLLHGWTGDEDVMWVFASRLPAHYLMIAPRGLFNSKLGGYGWYPDARRDWPSVDDFEKSINDILNFMDELKDEALRVQEVSGKKEESWQALSQGDFSQISLVGFSQGAALSYVVSLMHPQRVKVVAGLAGFMPENAERLVEKRPLGGKDIFVTHGSRDDIVPVERARSAVDSLERAGARVTYCEEDVGHKLSAPCFNALKNFFEGR
jgi:phospholipase/carboxylesterase